MKESGANEDLLGLLLGSIDDWDEKMQEECAKAFITPLKEELVSKENKQKILRLSVEITTNEACKNESLIESWMEVFAQSVGRVDIDYVRRVVLSEVKGMPNVKNPMPLRQKGNRLITAMALNMDEQRLEQEPSILKMIANMGLDTNIQIRQEAASFFKEFMQQRGGNLVGSKRLNEVYLPEICELLSDEESYVRIEAIEAILEVLEKLDQTMIEKEFIPSFLKALCVNNNHDDITIKMSKMVGKIVYKLSVFDLHLKHKDLILHFYSQMLNHKDEQCNINALFNLPCFNALFKNNSQFFVSPTSSPTLTRQESVDEEQKIDPGQQQNESIDFQGVYYQFATNQNSEMRKITASCLHEAFNLTDDNQDIRQLQLTFLELLQDQEKTVLQALVQNLENLIEKYCNSYAIEQTPDPLESKEDDEAKQNGGAFLHSKSLGSRTNALDLGLGSGKTKMSNKGTSKHLNFEFSKEQDEESPFSRQYFILNDKKSEVVYQELLPKLLMFAETIQQNISMWRELVQFYDQFAKTVHLFHTPEVHDNVVDNVFGLLKSGTNGLRQAIAKLLVGLIANQHEPERRETLSQKIVDELGQASAFHLRKTFVFFCKESAGVLPSQYFVDNFYQCYKELARDKVPSVRLEFTKALLEVKPYLDGEQERDFVLQDIMDKLSEDPCADVKEVAENAEAYLLTKRKILRSKFAELDEKANEQEEKLSKRFKAEEEERKRREQDEEENKFDYQTYLLEAKKNPARKSYKGKGKTGGLTASTTKASAVQRSTKMTGVYSDSTSLNTLKKKNIVSKRNSSALPNGVMDSGIKTEKDRKSQIMLPISTKDIMDGNKIGGGSLAAAGSTNQGAAIGDSVYRRSNSLLNAAGIGMDTKKKTLKLAQDEYSNIDESSSGYHHQPKGGGYSSSTKK